MDIHKLLQVFEHAIVYVIIIMLMVVIALTTGELAWVLFTDIVQPPIGIFEIEQLLE